MASYGAAAGGDPTVCAACGSAPVPAVHAAEAAAVLSAVGNDVLGRNMLRKLYARGRIRSIHDYEEVRTLGEGTFGEVKELRKRVGGAVFAAKLYKEERLSLDKLAFAGVLSELRALLRVNAGWQASDVLDDRWCPLVQLHGLFLTPQVGLLMEKYGMSLFQMLRDETELKEFDAYNSKNAGLGYITIASNVASACRYLHDIGLLHRDLKDANVLVEKGNEYRAKLTDFGTSQRARQVLAGALVGTIHAMAPEALAAAPPRVDGRTFEPRAVDVYAYGILLQSLWDRGGDWRRHVPQSAVDEVKLDEQYWDLNLNQKGMLLLVVYKCITVNTKRWPETGGFRPPPAQDMPEDVVRLYHRCVLLDPKQRPSFWEVCEDLKPLVLESRKRADGAQTEAASYAKSADWWRVVLTVAYHPVVSDGGTLTLHLQLASEACTAPLKPLRVAATSLDEERNATLVFPFKVRSNETVTLLFSGVEHYVVDDAGGKPRALLAELKQAVTVPRPGAPAVKLDVILSPDWAALSGGAQPAPAGGTPTSVVLKAIRTPPGGDALRPHRSLGVLSLLLGPRPGVLRLPSRSRGGRVMLPPPLAPARDFEYDVVLSYRDTDTGVRGSNFVFRLQEALEQANYSVFCYANLSVSEKWRSPFLHGVGVCRVFMPICSPEYGDLDIAPWGAAELLHAAALSAVHRGVPAILPVFHSGARFPPNADTADVLNNFRDAVVPDRNLYVEPARRMAYRDIFTVILHALARALAAQYAAADEAPEGDDDAGGDLDAAPAGEEAERPRAWHRGELGARVPRDRAPE